jgi:hypothetical protein
VLQLSAAGYNAIEHRTGKSPVLNTAMEKSDALLQEVVVVAYGVQQKRREVRK